jgi:hypothetical protein
MKYENFIWNPLNEDDLNSFPPAGEYVLLSFSNVPLPAIGVWIEDDGGGAFYDDEIKRTFSSFGAFVNAWAPLPENYKD